MALVLAAGAGRRLSGNKALLLLHGQRALQRCLGALREGGATELRVVLGHQADEVLDAVDLSDCQVVLNPHPDRGQTSSLQAGLAASPCVEGPCLLHTVDQPLLQAHEVASLLAAWAGRPAEVEIVLPSVAGRRGHPVVLGALALAELRDLPEDAPAHRVIRRDPARILHVELDAPWLVRDIDTPDDLEHARRELQRRAGV